MTKEANMPSRYRLKRLNIAGFRAFSNFVIEDLADVNLIVGKNNIGKTSLLEALKLYFAGGSSQKILEILFSREEYSIKKLNPEITALAYESLFFGRPKLEIMSAIAALESKFEIGPSPEQALNVKFSWFQEVIDETEGILRVRPLKPEDLETYPEPIPGLSVRIRPGERTLLLPFVRLDRRTSRTRFEQNNEISPIVSLPSDGMGIEEVGRIWDSIALTEDEESILTALQTLFPSLEKLVLVEGPVGRRTSRILMVKMRQFQEPVPFKSLGEGTNHLLGIFLALIKARGGTLLVDEIENGIHYSIQPHLWRIIFQQARAWDIQVFATTHSWDCVEGFEIAGRQSAETTCSLFRLEYHEKVLRAVQFLPDEVEIARQNNIEVR